MKFIEEQRDRKLTEKYPDIFVDGMYLKRCQGGEFENYSVLTAIGDNNDGYRELAIDEAQCLKYNILRDLKMLMNHSYDSLNSIRGYRTTSGTSWSLRAAADNQSVTLLR